MFQTHSTTTISRQPEKPTPDGNLDIPEVICRYFEQLNAGNFTGVSELFAANGVLYPPFEEGVIGPDAIATYLHKEASDMTLTPKRVIGQTVLAPGQIQHEIFGQVQTPFFRVNVGWRFVLDQEDQILAVGVKLLASLEELLNLRKK
jgi:hypothetical protein